MEEYQKHLHTLSDLVITNVPKLALAVVIWIIGFWLAKKLTNVVGKSLDRSSLSKEIKSFLQSFISLSLKVVLVFIIASVLGIKTSSFVAIIAAAGFAVGMAVQGSLGNFAAGIIILLFRPYRV